MITIAMTQAFADTLDDPSKTAIHIGNDKNDIFLGKEPSTPNSNQCALLIRGGNGQQFSDIIFENLMGGSADSFKRNLIYLVQQNRIEVKQDGSLLTLVQIANYTAP